MTVLPIVTAPDLRLNLPSEKVETVTDDIRTLMDDMLETMYQADGIGLAAIQVGVPKRIVVIDIEQAEDGSSAMKFVNPEIVWSSEENGPYEEGCLSFPAQRVEITRPLEVKVKYLDATGKEQELHATGLLATCLQHEIDHTNGVVLVDHASRLKRESILRKLTKARKLGDTPEYAVVDKHVL